MSERKIVQTNAAIGEKGFIHIYGGDVAAPKPFVVGIHGGGWRNGEQLSYEWLWARVKPLGVALALPSYRLSPAFRFPSAYEDLLHAMAWLREKGAAHGLDAGRCALLGGSAGGHWVMLLATRARREGQAQPFSLAERASDGVAVEQTVTPGLREGRTEATGEVEEPVAADVTPRLNQRL